MVLFVPFTTVVRSFLTMFVVVFLLLMFLVLVVCFGVRGFATAFFGFFGMCFFSDSNLTNSESRFLATIVSGPSYKPLSLQ